MRENGCGVQGYGAAGRDVTDITRSDAARGMAPASAGRSATVGRNTGKASNGEPFLCLILKPVGPATLTGIVWAAQAVRSGLSGLLRRLRLRSGSKYSGAAQGARQKRAARKFNRGRRSGTRRGCMFCGCRRLLSPSGAGIFPGPNVSPGAHGPAGSTDRNTCCSPAHTYSPLKRLSTPAGSRTVCCIQR